MTSLLTLCCNDKWWNSTSFVVKITGTLGHILAKVDNIVANFSQSLGGVGTKLVQGWTNFMDERFDTIVDLINSIFL